MHKISEVAAIPRNAAAAMAVVIRRARTAIAAAATRSVHAVAKAMHSVRAVMCSALRVIVVEVMRSAIARAVMMCSAIAPARGTNAHAGTNASVIRSEMFGGMSARRSGMRGLRIVANTVAMPAKTGVNTAATLVKTGVTIAATRGTTGAIIAAMRVSIGRMTVAKRKSAGSTTANTFASRIGSAGAFAITIAAIAVTSIA
jgi:hypothetical protein